MFTAFFTYSKNPEPWNMLIDFAAEDWFLIKIFIVIVSGMYVYLYENKLNHYKFCQRITDVIATSEL